MVAPGSTIRSDGWDSYNLLTKYGYLHTPVSHAQSASGDATPLAHRVASLLKRWWLGTHQGEISHEHLVYYLMSSPSASTGARPVHAVSSSTALSNRLYNFSLSPPAPSSTSSSTHGRKLHSPEVLFNGQSVKHRKLFIFNDFSSFIRVRSKAQRSLVLRQMNEFLSVSPDGNKYGALLLTIIELINQVWRRTVYRKARASAVQHDNPSPDPPTPVSSILRSMGRGRCRDRRSPACRMVAT